MKAIQVRMARAAVGWGVRELAKKAGVTANTVTRIENGADAKQSTMDRLQQALEAAGVEFIDENGGGPGVRLQSGRKEKVSPDAMVFLRGRAWAGTIIIHFGKTNPEY